jgi:hypothetical protein
MCFRQTEGDKLVSRVSCLERNSVLVVIVFGLPHDTKL